MSLSGTVTYKDTRDQLITDALLNVGAVGLGQAIDSDLILFAARKLQKMLKAWMADGLQLWKIKETTVFLNQYQNYYQLGPTGDNFTIDKPTHKSILTASIAALGTTITVDNTSAATWTKSKFNSAALVAGMYVGIQQTDNSMYWTTVDTVPNTTSFTIPTGLPIGASSGATVFAYTTKANRPLAVWDAMRRDKSDNDVPIMIISRNELYTFGRKVTSGTPTQFFFNPSTQQQVPGSQNAELWCYVAPGLGTDRLVFNAQYPIEDMTSADTDFDFPQEWLLGIETNLSLLVAPAHATTGEQYGILKDIAKTEKDRVMSWDRENASMYLMPQRRFDQG